MSIQQNELVFRQPEVRADGASNGGRMTATEIVSGVTTNILPNVTKQERISGITRYRKIFLHVSNTENLTYIAPSVFLDKYTQKQDSVTLFLGTQTDTESDISGTERQYGSGQLDTSLNVGDQVVKVATEGSALNMFRDGDKVRISDMDSVISASGNEQEVTIDGVPTYSGDVCTFNIVETIGIAFSSTETRVMSLIKNGDMHTDYDSFVVTTAGSGDYDDTANPVVLPNLSAIEQNWTLTVTGGGSQMQVVGDTVGDLGAFSIGSDISPANPSLLSPYFTLEVAGMSGTYADGDTIVFATHPNSLPLWVKQIVPVGTTDLTGNLFSIGTDGESA